MHEHEIYAMFYSLKVASAHSRIFLPLLLIFIVVDARCLIFGDCSLLQYVIRVKHSHFISTLPVNLDFNWGLSDLFSEYCWYCLTRKSICIAGTIWPENRLCSSGIVWQWSATDLKELLKVLNLVRQFIYRDIIMRFPSVLKLP